MSEVLYIINSLIWLGSKFLMGMGFILIYDFKFWESILIAVLGGMLGVFFFTYGSAAVAKLWERFFSKKENVGIQINWWKRLLVKMRRRLGLRGIAFLTPFITVPIGVFMALSVEKNKTKIFIHMFASFLFWSLTLTGIYEMTGININNLFH